MEIDYRFKAVEPLQSLATLKKVSKDNLYWKSYKFPITVNEHGAVTHLDFQRAASSNLLAVCSSTRIQLYNQVTCDLVKTFSRFKDVVYGATFRKDGKLLAAGCGDGSVCLYDIIGKIPLRSFQGHSKAVQSVKFCNDLYRIYSASDDKTVRLWDIATEKSLAILQGHNDYVRCAFTSPASQEHIATGSYDHTAKIWDLRTKETVCTVNHGHPVEAVLVHPSGSILFTAGSDKIKVWDILQGGRLLTTMSPHHKTITCMKFNDDCNRLITGSLDKHVKIIDASSYDVVHSIDYPSSILSISCSKNDRTLAVGMTDKTLSLRQRKQVMKEEILKQREEDKLLSSKNNRKDLYTSLRQSDTLIPSAKIKEFKNYDHHFRKFDYSKALDTALKQKDVEEKMGVFAELLRREGLKRALAGRTENQVIGIIKLIIKNMTNPAYSSILLDVSEVLLDVYIRDILTMGTKVQDAFVQLRHFIGNEIKLQREMYNILGCLENISQSC